MRAIITTLVVILGLLTAAAAVPARALPQVDLAVIINLKIGVTQMSAVEMEAVFTRTQTRWDDGAPIVPINAPPGADARVAFDSAVLRIDPDAVGRFWIDRRIRGLGMPPRHLDDPASIVRVVEKLTGAISYVPEELARGARVRIVARVRQGKVMLP